MIVGERDRPDVVGKASTQDSGFQGSGWAAMENEKDTTLTAITLGSKYFSYVQSPAPSHTQTLSNPFRNLTNKVRGKIFYKEVFLRLSVCVVYYCVFIIVRLSIIVSLWCCMMLHDTVNDYIILKPSAFMPSAHSPTQADWVGTFQVIGKYRLKICAVVFKLVLQWIAARIS